MLAAAPSFRDPAGCCCTFRERVLRRVAANTVPEFEAFLQTPAARQCIADKKLVSTRRLAEREVAELLEIPELNRFFFAPGAEAVYEHERVAFPSYPHEWPPEMLWAAGQLTLELARATGAAGFGLKDATPHNILFRGPDPVFIDALSFERRHPADPLWLPEAQFVRTFLLPLLANRRWALPLAEVFTTRRDGLEPEAVYRWCGPLEKFTPRLLSLVSLPTWLSRRTNPDDQRIYQPRRLADPEQAQFILASLFRRLARTLDGLGPAARKSSSWSDYMSTHRYADPAFAAKEAFVAEALREFKPARVLDAGANTGHFSALAARAGAAVVAVDLDEACVGTIWRQAQGQRLDILPLVVNLARPSPALGWRNAECPSFLNRAAGAFDGVLMLALIHHLLVTERIPLEEILRLAYELTRSLLVVELVEPQDAMFRRLTRGREQLHASLDAKMFEQACMPYFEIVRSLALPGTRRRLYCLKRRSAAR
ncbi:MAG TPA: methyltransferase domain-containing protein [Candidatus Acidoferrum sp.]|nr:methyltransferase domain-containing protein [Candidatus Acidoferrum sp.]